MCQPLLTVEGLKIYFQGRDSSPGSGKALVRAVDGVSFTIDEGKTLGLVGESGCGKSTVGRALVGLNNPIEGRISFMGQSIGAARRNSGMRELRKQMQFIFQDPFSSLNPRMRVHEIIGRPLDRTGRFDPETRRGMLVKLMNDVGLSEEHLQRYPHEFSGGQRQRISVARSLAMNPRFIVADEPTSALDVSIQSQILNLMMDLKSSYQLSMLFISHDLEVVRYIADDIAVMYLGKLVEKGPRDALFDHPLHPYTKALLSAIPYGPGTKKANPVKLGSIIPSPSSPPSGCRLHTRCPFSSKRCAEEEPELVRVGTNRFVACHYYDSLS